MTGHKKHTVADVRAEEMAELLKKWDWTFDAYVNSREMWGKCSKGHRKQFDTGRLRKAKRQPACNTCTSADMVKLLQQWEWTLDAYVNSVEVWGKCSSGHGRKFTTRQLGELTREPFCDICASAEMAGLLEKWGWTFDSYVNSVEVYGSCPNGHRKKFPASNLRELTQGPRCDTCLSDDGSAEMAELLEQWNWTLSSYINSDQVWGACPNGHRKKLSASTLRKWTRGPFCSVCQSADLSAKMTELLEKWGWTFDTYVTSDKVWGVCPSGHRKRFTVQRLKKMKRGPNCGECR